MEIVRGLCFVLASSTGRTLQDRWGAVAINCVRFINALDGKGLEQPPLTFTGGGFWQLLPHSSPRQRGEHQANMGLASYSLQR